MKKDELVHMIAEAIQKSTITTVNKLTDEEIRDCAWSVVEKIAPKLVIEKVIVVSGSIDDCPDYAIYNPDGDYEDCVHNRSSDEDDDEYDHDGFDKDDLEETLIFNLLED